MQCWELHAQLLLPSSNATHSPTTGFQRKLHTSFDCWSQPSQTVQRANSGVISLLTSYKLYEHHSSLLSSFCDKHYDQQQLGKERVYLTYISWSQSILERSQGRNSRWSWGRNHNGSMSAHWLPSRFTFSYFLKEPRPTWPRYGITHSRIGPPTSIRNGKNAHRPIWGRQLFGWGFFFQMYQIYNQDYLSQEFEQLI